MKTRMQTLAVIAGGLAMAPICAQAAMNSDVSGAPISYEQQLAQLERDQIMTAPIAGRENDKWFNYNADVAEARHELVKDLRRATDAEDQRDAWDEYRGELADARKDYVKAMRAKGYPVGTVTVQPYSDAAGR